MSVPSDQLAAETQPESPDIADRLSNALFGAEPAETEAESEAPETPEPEAPAEEFAEVEYEGERFQVPKKLEKAILQERDYTRKAQEVADQRRAVELVQQQQRAFDLEREFHQSVREEASELARLDAHIDQYKTLDWSSLSTDELVRHRHALDQLKDKRQETLGKIEGKRGEFAQRHQAAQQEMLQKGVQWLKGRVPAWDEATAKKVAEHGLSLGYTQQEMASVTDPRHALTLFKAMEYDRLMASRDAAVQKASKAAPLIKPSSSKPMAPDVKDQLNYRKSLDRARDPQQRRRVVEERIGKIFGG